MRRLPPVHQATLRLLIEHLARVAAHRDRNKMDPKNLSIVFGGLLFGDDDMPKDGNVLSVAHTKVRNFWLDVLKSRAHLNSAGHGAGRHDNLCK